MPQIVLAALVGIGLALLSRKDSDKLRSQLDAKENELKKAREQSASDAEIDAVREERDDLRRKLDALEAGEAARKAEAEAAKKAEAEAAAAAAAAAEAEAAAAAAAAEDEPEEQDDAA